ncbi:MAG: single-stranded DNA-binding protein [Alistipes sp.]|nr:single-stranded DNA-binding protein [Alistipes sp.]
MINKVILVGNVGIDPEVRTTESGVKVARVRLATSERYVDKQSGERKELTEWHTITLWRGLADIVDRYVHKGSQLYIEGRLRTREWVDKDQVKRYTTEILADNMQLLGSRGDNSNAAASAPAAAPAAPAYQQPAQSYQAPAAPAAIPTPQEDPDDLPF